MPAAERGAGLPTKLYEDVLENLPSLRGRVVAITGCTTGLGYYAALLAARKGASKILLLNRASERAQKAQEDVSARAEPGTEVVTVDTNLQELASVRLAAEKVKSLVASTGLHVLALNAGVMAMDDKRTGDGFDVQMQTNQLSHVLLLKLLMPELERAAAGAGEARVAFHSSSARDISGKKLEEKYFQRCKEGSLGGDRGCMPLQALGLVGGPWQRYHQSKLANVAFAMRLHEELQSRGSRVRVAVADPGFAVTQLAVTSAHIGCFAKLEGMCPRQSAQDGCTNLAMACFSPEAESGDFFMPEKLMTGWPKKSISKGVPVKKGSEKLSTDSSNLDGAWRWSLAALGLDSLF